VAAAAWRTAARVIADTDIALDIAVFDRDGRLMGRAPFRPAHDAS
jgi:cobalt-precorrin-5B (C1)-methyltransferase